MLFIFSYRRDVLFSMSKTKIQVPIIIKPSLDPITSSLKCHSKKPRQKKKTQSAGLTACVRVCVGGKLGDSLAHTSAGKQFSPLPPFKPTPITWVLSVVLAPACQALRGPGPYSVTSDTSPYVYLDLLTNRVAPTPPRTDQCLNIK